MPGDTLQYESKEIADEISTAVASGGCLESTELKEDTLLN